MSFDPIILLIVPLLLGPSVLLGIATAIYEIFDNLKSTNHELETIIFNTPSNQLQAGEVIRKKNDDISRLEDTITAVNEEIDRFKSQVQQQRQDTATAQRIAEDRRREIETKNQDLATLRRNQTSQVTRLTQLET